MTEKQENEALEKLNQGIQDSKRMVQQRTMKLAQEYFDDSAAVLEQQIKESRATLEDLPDQIPGGQEEEFQRLFRELMNNYAAMERCIKEAQKRVSDLDMEQFREPDLSFPEIESVDAGQLDASGLNDLTESAENGAAENLKASDAARRKADELGVDLTQVEGTGSGGNIVVGDVTDPAEDSKAQATEAAEQVQDALGQTSGQTQETLGQAGGQTQEALGQAGGQLGQIAQQAQETTGGATEGMTNQAQEAAEGPKVTSAARRKAEELGVDLDQMEGTGAGGLITLKDVMGA